jgi:predicted RNA-binding protein with PUA-like domain
MNYWWVNHKQTFNEERAGNYIWSPKEHRNGSNNDTYHNLRRFQVGDKVFSYASAQLGAVGLAERTYDECDRPSANAFCSFSCHSRFN